MVCLVCRLKGRYRVRDGDCLGLGAWEIYVSEVGTFPFQIKYIFVFRRGRYLIRSEEIGTDIVDRDIHNIMAVLQ
jgi:hypothetical protein